jgi:protein SCO1/2
MTPPFLQGGQHWRCFAGGVVKVLGLALIVAASAAAASDPALDQTAALAASRSAVGKPIGDYLLYDRDGNPVRLSRYRGRPLLVSFVYTGCFQVCPTTTRFLAKAIKAAQDALGANSFATVTIGFNLPFDNPQAMKSFAKQQGITLTNWDFLSPAPATVEPLTRDFGFSYAPTPKGFDHITQVTIVDQQGRVFRQVYGESFEIPMLVGPLKELITGSPSPTQNLAELLEQVRVFCTVYDPRSGTYRLNYGLFIEIFAGLSILGSTLYLLVAEWRRSRRVRRA